MAIFTPARLPELDELSRLIESFPVGPRVRVLGRVDVDDMWLGSRANPRGVDLMRNAPRHPESRGTYLVGGQRISRRLPWFAGDPERGLELESRVLIDAMERELLPARVAIAIDCHSGFGL